jgi:hypothetical protein
MKHRVTSKLAHTRSHRERWGGAYVEFVHGVEMLPRNRSNISSLHMANRLVCQNVRSFENCMYIYIMIERATTNTGVRKNERILLK